MGISKRAEVSTGAIIDESVNIGPYSIIGADVEIGAGCVIESHVVIQGPTKIGKNNHIYSFACIGGDPQDISYEEGQDSELTIGDDNQIREFCTINRGTEKQDAITKIGSNNMLMAYVHVAHDCVIGNHVVLTNNTTLAGHVEIEDWAILGGFTLVKQFSRIGSHAYIGMGCQLNKDIPPYVIVSGMPARVKCINSKGLKTRGFGIKTVSEIKKAFKIIYGARGRLMNDALEEIQCLGRGCEDSGVTNFLTFIKKSKNGILRGPRED